ncbi:hypothetical protein WB401_21800 [Streptomyces brasiliscabiei]|uniref:Secreted protein n=2 Tax=Streptomyces TaxID=1883 RepID=A0ABU8GAN1_9ACTN|nr:MULTISPECIES: hypothetical protein [Streptomyces]MBZ3900818.1 hypothetical protein [Streptomyces griseiscabiei]MDX2909055.1 hypothetical protein [Streptomyces griseiscabiei]
MKPTTRGTLAAVVTGVVAAVGASAAPAAAAETVPVPLPLEGVEHSLNVKAPKLAGQLPLLMPGAPQGPTYAEGRLLPASALPQVPLGAALPGLKAEAPLPRVVGEGFERVGVDAPAADLRTLTPGLDVDAPLSAADPDALGLPSLQDPQAAVLTPLLRTAPTANLGLV